MSRPLGKPSAFPLWPRGGVRRSECGGKGSMSEGRPQRAVNELNGKKRARDAPANPDRERPGTSTEPLTTTTVEDVRLFLVQTKFSRAAADTHAGKSRGNAPTDGP